MDFQKKNFDNCEKISEEKKSLTWINGFPRVLSFIDSNK